MSATEPCVESVAATDDAAAVPEASLRYPGWRVVAICFVIAVFSWGFGFYGHGFYLAELRRAYGWPASVVAGATTLYYLVSAIILAFVGEAMRRYGVRPVVVAGILCMAASAALVPVVTAPWQLYLDYLLMALGWAATSIAAITTILGLWFRDKRGLAISLGLTGASFGGILVVPALAFLTGAIGFGPAVWSIAAVFVLAGVSLVVLGFGTPPSRTEPAAATRAPEATRWQILADGHFWSVSAPFALAFFTQVGFLVHQIALLEPSVGRAVAGVAVTTASAVLGRLVLGSIIDWLDQRRATAASFFSQALALVVVWQAHDPVVLILACAMFGFSVDNLITLPALIIQREFSAREFATIIGLSTAVCQISYSFGPGLLGLLRDLSGGYSVPLILGIALDALAAAAILLPRRPREIG
jgi:MFS family permease